MSFTNSNLDGARKTCNRKPRDTNESGSSANIKSDFELQELPLLAQGVVIKQNETSYLKLYSFATTLDKLLILIGVFASIICGVLQPYLLILFGDASGVLIEYTSTLLSKNLTETEKAGLDDELYDAISYFVVYTVVVSFVTLAMTYIGALVFAVTSTRQTFKMRQQFLERTLSQDIGWYDQNPTGNFSSVLTDNIPKIEDGMGDKVGQFIFYCATFVAGVIWALLRGWKLALVCLTSFPVQTAVLSGIGWLSAKYCKQEMQAYGAAGAIAEEVLGSVRTVIAFDGQNKECQRYDNYVKEARNNNLRRCLFNAISQAFFWFLAYACFALAFWYGTGLVLEERALPIDQITYSPGNMISVFFSTLSGSIALGSTGPFLEVFGMAKGAAKDVFAVLESKPLMHENKDSGKKPNFKTNISFRNVDFCYPSRPDVQVLKNVNVEIVFGDTVALVGHSGSGKSTVVQLLQRFYDPDAGSVSIDNVDLKEVNISYLRQNVGVVSQEPALFATTIAENIRFGKLNATKEEIINAAKIANAHKFIKSLPNGYETIIGARGTQLSGGQKQRVAIARALIKEPNLLILDEATSALDTESEAEVQTTLDSISRVCTKVIVAHRLSTIRNANRIIVFSNGIIVEEGSHESLMESKGVYYNMIESQGYTDISAHSKSKELTKQRAKSIASSVEEQEHKKLDDEFEAEKLEEKKGNLGVMLKILSANKPEWFSMLMGSIASVLNGASLPLYGLVFGNILGVLSLTDEVIVRQLSITYSLQFFYLGILSGVCMFLQIYAFSYSGEQLTYRLRNMMFDSMLKQEIGWFDRKENAVGALCAQLSGDAASVQGAGGSRIGIIINSLATVILSFVFGLYLEWRLALIAGSFFPLVLFSLYYETKSMQSGSSKTQKLLQKSAKVAVEAIENIRTVKSLGCENVFNGAYLKELVTCKKMAIRKCHFRGVILGLARSLVSFAYAPGLWFGVRLVTSNQVDNATVFKVLEVVITGSMSIGTALSFSSNMQKGLSAAARIFGLFNREPLIKSPLNPIDLKLGDGHVEYSRLYFAYPTRPTIQILNGLNLSVLKGKTVALVGSSGCGKSTLIQLLERFYDPTSGDIEIDDNDIKSADLKSLRCHLGIVSQEPNLFDKTIAENIAYGDNERAVEMHEIESAAKAANIHNFIVSLPLGYETRLGSKGTQLSGGQKQRIAIARALLRNPKILLLDEATSALDNESEKVVQQALDNARKGRTCITIAHRLTTVQDADLICVLKDGIVSEMGTHTELLSRQGLYYEYYKLQSGQF